MVLETIMGILRHADIRETLIYAPYSLQEGRSAINKLDDQSAPMAGEKTASPSPTVLEG